MSPPKLSPRDIGTPRYYELLHQEKDYWERTARGETDVSVATWRDAELADAIKGDLRARALDLVVARGSRVLELGCAAGGLSTQLARRGCVVDGLDIAVDRITLGVRQVGELRAAENWPGDVRFFVSDLNRLALAPDKYDVVLAATTLHHVLDLEHFIGELYKTLKPGGTLICLDHIESSPLGLALMYFLLDSEATPTFSSLTNRCQR
jgi:2-polyprenyl-3-methyl-5-hydroxy-6-metoxy-1,4-benzoquinol methylase